MPVHAQVERAVSGRAREHVSETSIVSYLTARPSRELVRAAHQKVTRDWWTSRGSFELSASQFVLDEAAAGDAGAAADRLAALAEAVVLDVTEDMIILAKRLIAGGGLPSKARVDALHVALRRSTAWTTC
jgi:hypothetical protein